jgi:hypothetical protein
VVAGTLFVFVCSVIAGLLGSSQVRAGPDSRGGIELACLFIIMAGVMLTLLWL